MKTHGLAAVLDANVLPQAMGNPDGPAGACLAKGLSGQYELVISQYVLDEVRRIASYPKVRKRFPNLRTQCEELAKLFASRNWIRATCQAIQLCPGHQGCAVH